MPPETLAPTAVCPIIQTDTPDLDQTNHAIASMMLALREGRHFHIEPGRIQWNDENDRQRYFPLDGPGWYADEAVTGPGPHPTLPPGDEARELQNRIDHLLQASLKEWTIRGGRRPDPEGNGNIGFITWDRVSHANVPRLEIDPDGTITYWYHWPEPDLPARDTHDFDRQRP